jgi:hypothetical protein
VESLSDAGTARYRCRRRPVRRVLVAAFALVLSSPVLPAAGAGRGSVDAPPFEVVRQIGGRFTGIAAGDGHIYVGIGSRVAVLSDDEDGTGPHLVGLSSPVPEPLRGLVSVRSGTVVAAGAGRVYFVSVANPRAPALVATVDVGEPVVALASNDELCFVLAEQSLRILQSPDPRSPVELGRLLLPLKVSSRARMVASDGLVFVSAPPILVIDVGEPSAPGIIGGIEEPVGVQDLAASGRTLYVLDGQGRVDANGQWIFGTWVYVLEVSIDNRLVRHGSVSLVPPGPRPYLGFIGSHLAAVDQNVYVTGYTTPEDGFDQQSELRCWDFADPRHPVETARVVRSTANYVDRLIARGNRLYMGADNGAIPDGGHLSPVVSVVDVRDGDSPTWLGRWQLGEPGYVSAVATVGQDFAFHEAGGHTHLYDGSDPSALVSTGYIDIDAAGAGVARLVGNNRTLYALWTDVRAFDVSDRSRPTEVARSDRLAGVALPVIAVSEPYILTAEGEPGVGESDSGYRLVVWERGGSGTARMNRLSDVVVGEMIDDIAVGGTSAFVVYRAHVGGTGAVAVVNLTDPTLPDIVVRFSMPDGVSAKRIAIRGPFAYVLARTEAREEGGIGTALFVLDVSDLTAIHIVGWFQAPRVGSAYEPVVRGQLYSVAMVGDFALLSGYEPLLRVVDVRDPRRLEEVQRIQLADIVSDLAVSERYAYVVLRDSESVILRASGGQEPVARRWAYLPLITTRASRHLALGSTGTFR